LIANATVQSAFTIHARSFNNGSGRLAFISRDIQALHCYPDIGCRSPVARLLQSRSLQCMSMKSAAVISKPNKAELQKIAQSVIDWLRAHDYQVWVDPQTAVYLPNESPVARENIAEQKPEFVIVLGGDGTLLATTRAVAAAGIPILGVNLGSLGFLTEVPLAEMYPTLEAVIGNQCGFERRRLVHCQLMRGGETVAEYHALNEVVANKSSLARLINIDLYIEQEFVSNYKADGLIVATPTGSTAYSLSAGGPILMPSVDAFIVTPVCPHSLTHRPLVVRDTSTIEIVARVEDGDAFLSVDGQVGTPMQNGDRVVCRRSRYEVKLLRMRKTFFDVLRTKLKWGQR
jgi:NAD+ kinase